MIQRYDRDGGVLELVIDRPPVNAFSIGLLHELARVLTGISDDPAIRVVLLRADGKGFCGGGDVKEVEALAGHEGVLGQASGSLAASLAILNCAVPVICVVHNYCIGVGVLISGSADVLLATPATRFVLAEIDNGATAGGAQALRILPEKRLRAAMMTAEPVTSEELLAYGSIYRISRADRIVKDAHDLASKIAAKNAAAMRRLKRSLNNTTRTSDVELLYRAELSYTYELNIIGDASAERSAFIAGTRGSYLAND
jgi:enoyl-CoA hydratase